MRFIAKYESIIFTLCKNGEQVIIHGIAGVVGITESALELHVAK